MTSPCRFWIGLALAALVLAASSGATLGPPKAEKRQERGVRAEAKRRIHEARKELAQLKKQVEKSFVCQGCGGGGRVVKQVVFGDRRQFIQGFERVCTRCKGLGVGANRGTYDVLSAYYASRHSSTRELGRNVELRPPFSKWLLRKIRHVDAALALTDSWRSACGHKGRVFIGAAEGVNAITTGKPAWTAIAANPVGKPAKQGYARMLLICEGSHPGGIVEGSAAGARPRFLVIAYNAGRETYDAWINSIADQEEREPGSVLDNPVRIEDNAQILEFCKLAASRGVLFTVIDCKLITPNSLSGAKAFLKRPKKKP